jgi:hypothetical protein
MIGHTRKTIRERFSRFLIRRFSRVLEINRKYANPRIKMTPMVSLSMLMLRLYLLFLVGVLFYKFYTLLK